MTFKQVNHENVRDKSVKCIYEKFQTDQCQHQLFIMLFKNSQLLCSLPPYVLCAPLNLYKLVNSSCFCNQPPSHTVLYSQRLKVTQPHCSKHDSRAATVSIVQVFLFPDSVWKLPHFKATKHLGQHLLFVLLHAVVDMLCSLLELLEQLTSFSLHMVVFFSIFDGKIMALIWRKHAHL